MLAAKLGRGALLSLLLGTSALPYAQQPATPASRQQGADLRFLAHRGIGAGTTGANPPSDLQAPAASPVQRLAAARERQAALGRTLPNQTAAQPALSGSTVWQSAGPVQLSTPAYGLVTGRISSVLADPNDLSGNTVYLGATGGGVWKSINAAGNAGSVTFRPLTDDIPLFANSQTSIPSLSIGALSVQPGNPGLVLAGTGDPNDALDSYYGVGILRSTDGGTTWSLVQQSSDLAGGGTNYSFHGLGFAGFAWSTATANLVVAAASQSLEGLLVNPGYISTAETGLYYSQDAGKTWHLSTITDGPNKVIQTINPMAQPPGNPATSVVWNPQRKLFLAAVRFHGYYSSPDGITWTRLTNQPGPNLSSANCPTNSRVSGNPSCPIFRGVLAVQAATGDTFALTADLNNVDQGLYQDACNTNGLPASLCSNTVSFGTKINDTALDASDGTIPQADYNLALAAVPSQQDTLLFAGTEDVFRCSLANSCQWRNTTNEQTCAAAQVAPSTHAIDGTFGKNGVLYFGNDGGLWRSNDAVGQTGPVCAATDASHFDNLNGGIGSLAEITHLAVTPGNGSLLLAGMGQFGVVASESPAAQGGTGAWQQLLTGEGSFVAIDPTNPSNWYADAGPGLAIYPCAQGGNCNAAGFSAAPAIGRAQVQNDSDYLVTNGLDPAPWILDPGNPSNILLGTCRMWLGPAIGGWSSGNLLSGMLDGNVAGFCNGNAQLRSVGAGGSYNAGGEQMYAGMAGPYDGGAYVPGHLYGATVPQSGGKVSWADLWRNPVTNSPFTPQFNAGGFAISSLAVDPHDTTGRTVYAGIAGFPTGQGGILYGSTDAGAHWANLTNSLPLAPVNAVAVDPNNAGYVYVGGDFGVYVATDITKCALTGQNGQNCWTQLGSGLPNAPITDLKVYSSGSTTVLEAATYGRGIWTLGLTTNPLTAQATLSPASYTFAGQGVGSAGAPFAFTLRNTGSAALTVSQVSATPSADYTQTNNCGASLASGGSCTIQVTFAPSVTGDRPGTLTVRANTPSGTLTAALDGTGLSPGVLVVNPGSLAFPSTTTGTSAATQAVTLSNTGGAPLTLGPQTLSGANAGDFSLSSSTCGSILAAGSQCTVSVSFSPSAAGTRTAQLTLNATSPSSSATVSLSGNAVTPASLALSPASLTYSGTTVGSASASQTVTVTNSGGTAASLGTPSTSPSDFTLTTNCGATLAPSTSCTAQITFTPTTSGSRTGLFTLPSTSAPGGQLTANLSGTGLKAATLALSPGSLTFASQTQGSTSAAKTITVANSGESAAQLGMITATGDFAVTSGCPTSLPAGAQCTLSVTFTPAAAGSRSGVLTVPYGNTGATPALSGTGLTPGALSFSPPSLSFGATASNSTSAAQTVTVTNSGDSPASISAIAVSGPFAAATNSCSPSVAAHSSCTLGLTFTPPDAASYSGTATLSGSFSNSPASLPLSGQGAAPPDARLTPNPFAFPDTVQGATSAPQSFTVTSTGGVAVTLGAPSVNSGEYQVTGTNCGGSLAPGNSCTVSALFHPGGTGPRPAAMLTVPGNMAGGSVTTTLSGNGLPPGAITLTPSSLQFSAQFTGTTSAAQTVTAKNTGGVAVAVGTPTTTGDYAVSSACPASLAPNGGCTLSVTFTPSVTGNRPGQLTVPWGAGQSTATTLDGTGTTPGHLVFSPSPLTFGNTGTGSSATNQVTVTNPGGTPAQFSAIGITGDFAVSPGGTCIASTVLAAQNGACTLNVTFSPTVTGSRSGVLTVTNDGAPPSAQEPLSGMGVVSGSVKFSPPSWQFGSVLLNSTASESFTATNNGQLSVSLGAPVVSGAGYRLGSNSCGATLAAGASCSLQVVFAPTAAGESAGTLNLPWGSGSTALTTLDGTGVTPGALTFTPRPVPFGPVVVGASATQTVAAQNTGGSPLALGAATASGGGFAVTSQCPSQLAPGAQCTLQVSFSPSAQGSYSGLLTFPSGGSSWTDALSGSGVKPGSLTASPTSVSYAAMVIGGSSAAQSIQFSNRGGVAVPLNPPRLSSSDYTLTNSTCGASLPPGGSCSVSVAFTPTAAGDRPGILTLASIASGGPSAQVALDGSGLRPAQLTFSPSALAFGGVPLGRMSSAQALTLTNTGDVSTTLGKPVATGPYTLTSTCGASLNAGANCQVAVTFVPSVGGSQPGTVSAAGPNGAPSATAQLSGTGLVLEVLPGTVTFMPAIAVGASSAPFGIAVENKGFTPMTLQPPTVSGDFVLGPTACGSTLQPDSACMVNVIFTPKAGGQRTGIFTVYGSGETQTVQLSGTGLSPATDTLSLTSLVFPATATGQTSAVQSVTLTNTGDATLTQIATQVSGNFVVSNNCGTLLGGHQSCVIAVSFAPRTIGQAGGTLSISDAQRTQSVALIGQGAAPPQAAASPSSIDFDSYAYGIASPAQVVTVSNGGTTPMANLSFTTTGQDFALSSPTGSSPCGASLAAGASCQVGVVFTPVVVGARQGTLVINSPSLSSPLIVGLAGSGEDYQFSVYGSNIIVITSGQTANYRFALSPTGASAGNITLTCSGAPLHSLCSLNPAAVQLANGVSGSIQLTVATGVTTSAAVQTPLTRWWPAGSALAALCPLFLLRGDARRRWLVIVIAGAILVAPLGCGVHASGINTSTGSGTGGTSTGSTGGTGGSSLGAQTPRGTYPITITATYPGAQRTATVTLVVE